MNIRLPYGTGEQSADAPDWNLEPLTPSHPEPLEDPLYQLAMALEKPDGGRPFDEVVRGASSVAIVLPDKTRKAAVDIILPVLLNILKREAVPDDGVSVIFATGIHPGQTEREKRAIVGDDVYDNYRCEDHNCDNDEMLTEVGELAGELLYLNRRAVEAERLILLGSIKPHYLAGYGGGRKLIMPGIAARSNTLSFHSLCLHEERPGRHHHADYMALDGNRMHERAMEGAIMAGVDYCVNVITDSTGRPVFINGGDVEESFGVAAKACKEMVATPLTERRGLVVASCGGYPADLNFIQAHKSLDIACRASVDGGTVILLAECADGIGNDSFLDWFRMGGPEAIYHGLRQNFEVNGQTAMSVREKSGSRRVILVSRLPGDDVRLMGMEPAESLEQAVRMAADSVPADTAGWLLPQAAATMPVERAG